MLTAALLTLIAVAYVVGSIPFGLVIGKAKGVDPRRAGSGNIGATNVGRLLGRRYFWIVFALDASKSLVPMLLGAAAVHHFAPNDRQVDWHAYLLWAGVGAGAIVGHMFSLFLGFRGGKGVATSAGVVLGLFPYFTLAAIPAICVYLLFFKVWRYVSLASIAGAISFPIFYATIGWRLGWPITRQQWPLLLMAVVFPTLIVVRHRANISRLIAGTETKAGAKVAKGDHGT